MGHRIHVFKFITIYLISTIFLLITTESNLDVVPHTSIGLPLLSAHGSLWKGILYYIKTVWPSV